MPSTPPPPPPPDAAADEPDMSSICTSPTLVGRYCSATRSASFHMRASRYILSAASGRLALMYSPCGTTGRNHRARVQSDTWLKLGPVRPGGCFKLGMAPLRVYAPLRRCEAVWSVEYIHRWHGVASYRHYM